MVFTTNKALRAWGRVLHDEDLGQAIIDRVLERGRLIQLDGPSVRTLHLKLDEAVKDESDQDDEVARISGTHTSDYKCTCLAAKDNPGAAHGHRTRAMEWDRTAAVEQASYCVVDRG
jgi:hypothetical protein